MRFWTPALLTLPLVLGGCFTTTTERVHVRRTEAELEMARVIASQTRESIREELFQASQKRRLDRALFAAETTRQEQRKRIRQLMAQIPDDPWASYEEDRRATFYRRWAGVRQRLPGLVPEGSGPPGWIGPKLPGAEAGEPVVEGLGEDEDNLGGEDEGDYGDEDEGDYGDEEEGDYGDDY